MAGASRRRLCPYCGHVQQPAERCEECGGRFAPRSLEATRRAMGPWSIRDRRLAFRPGCSYPILNRLIERGRISERTVLRGPTTGQFWSLAKRVPGVAHRLGVCHACEGRVRGDEGLCPHCGEVFPEPTDRDRLGVETPSEEDDAPHATVEPEEGNRQLGGTLLDRLRSGEEPQEEPTGEETPRPSPRSEPAVGDGRSVLARLHDTRVQIGLLVAFNVAFAAAMATLVASWEPSARPVPFDRLSEQLETATEASTSAKKGGGNAPTASEAGSDRPASPSAGADSTASDSEKRNPPSAEAPSAR